MGGNLGNVPGERQTLDGMFSSGYEDLCRLAAVVGRDYHQNTLNATSLVNEAWLKLAACPRFAFNSRLHFNRIVGRAMRQVLVDNARRHNAAKRGSNVTFVSLAIAAGEIADSDAATTLRRALIELARHRPRQAQIVRHRFFSGRQLTEIAVLLGVSDATVLRDWRAAKEWLAAALTASEPQRSSTRPVALSPSSPRPRI